MNDEETVALIAGGHSFGKTHGAGPGRPRGSRARGRPIEEQGLGWKSTVRLRQGQRHHHQWSRGHLDLDADRVGVRLLQNLFDHEWELVESPAGAKSGSRRTPRRRARRARPAEGRRPTMLTTDLALRFDPAYKKVSRNFYETRSGSPPRSPRPGSSSCTATWGRCPATSDRGSRSRSCGRTRCRPSTRASATRTSPRSRRRSSRPGCRVQLVRTAWASAATFRGTECAAAPTAPGSGSSRSELGGERPGRARRPSCPLSRGSSRTSTFRLHDLARRPDRAGRLRGGREGGEGRRPRHHGAFAPGRTDASQEQTDTETFSVLEQAMTWST